MGCGILVLLARVDVNVSQCTPVHLRCLWKCDSWSVETIICLACSIMPCFSLVKQGRGTFVLHTIFAGCKTRHPQFEMNIFNI